MLFLKVSKLCYQKVNSSKDIVKSANVMLTSTIIRLQSCKRASILRAKV